MGLPKGRTNNAKGRPKGIKNRKTSGLKDLVSAFLEQKWHVFETDFYLLDPKERILLYEKLLKYAIPTMQSAKAEIDVRQLSDEQLDDIIEKLVQ